MEFTAHTVFLYFFPIFFFYVNGTPHIYESSPRHFGIHDVNDAYTRRASFFEFLF